MTSVNHRNPEEEEKLELMDEFYDYNINFKINLCTKGFFDKIISNVLFKAKERTSLIKKANANRFSVCNIKTSNLKFKEKENSNFSDFTNKCNKESRSFLSEMIKSTANKIRNQNEKKKVMGQKDFFLNNFEFHKSNNNNIGVNISRKFLDITIKNCIIKLNKSDSFLENRRSLEMKFLERKSKIGNKYSKQVKEVNEYYSKNIDMNENKCFKYASEFFAKAVKDTIQQQNPSILAIDKNLISNQIQNKDESLLAIDNDENENSKFTKSFFTEKVRKTVTQIYIEKENLESKCNSFSNSFYNDQVRKTVSSIDTERLKNVNIANNSPGENVLQILENKQNSVKIDDNSMNKQPIRNLSDKLDDKMNKKFEDESFRKSEIAEYKLLQEKQEIDKEIELSRIRDTSYSFWGKTLNNTMIKYNQYHDILVKNVIKIQSAFRMNLWRLIIKIELMNVRIQKENERAMAASKRRRSIDLIRSKN